MEEFKEQNVEQQQEQEVQEVEQQAQNVEQPKEEKVEAVAQPADDFDWDGYAKGESISEEEKNKLTDLYEKTLSQVKDKEVVDGTIISMNKREVVVNIGFKSDGIIPMSEFRYNPDLKVGDTVEVFVENQEDKKDNSSCRTNKLAPHALGNVLTKHFDNDEIIKGFIKCRTKGGMIVDVFGIEAFLPGSQQT